MKRDLRSRRAIRRALQLMGLENLWHLACWAMLRWALHDLHPTDDRLPEVLQRLHYRELMLPR